MSEEKDQVAEVEPTIIDAGTVVLIVGDEKQQIPMPLPAVLQQLFAILGDLDRRLMDLEANNKRIVTLD